MIHRYNLVNGKTCQEVLANYPDYKVFWRSGFAYRGASESEDDKQPQDTYLYEEGRTRETTFEERMQRRYNWSAVIDIKIDEEKKEIHFNGFSENDMY